MDACEFLGGDYVGLRSRLQLHKRHPKKTSQCSNSQACPHGPHDDSSTCTLQSGSEIRCRTWTGHQNTDQDWTAQVPRFHVHVTQCPDGTTVPEGQACPTPDCVPPPGQHAHGAVCEEDHAAVPSCVPGVPSTQTFPYTTHEANGQNTTVSVAPASSEITAAVSPP